MIYKFCVSGAASTDHCHADTMNKTKILGSEIVKHNGVVITGATIGVPLWAAMGAKEEKGVSIGLSPASSELEHVKKYKLPTEEFDIIIYTGFGYSGRNLLLTRSADAVIIICGRMGTLNEFTIAFEDGKPIGILSETGGMADELPSIIEKAHRGSKNIVFDSNPKSLIEKLIKMIEEEKVKTSPEPPYREEGM
ncbi:hypothetical protein A3F08_01505 [Candidatus Berkelbacteria bacterium RIFCSPHIGHO2_12_FULL_36_9]|uniref:Protein containing YHS domain protein n=1 Tax=Candidatus Berkelbacteria bacterium RIFCSPHIGHO2_12_FULL_36_9 TaxID=1797469 RepID=A0A1F5EK95_9BACT|nr:MAG: hypothetical protein A3F08_01505 [Candidatus Berkelbacteria bacterium RIFCSPHIGHO2_12_FULL_36_9]